MRVSRRTAIKGALAAGVSTQVLKIPAAVAQAAPIQVGFLTVKTGPLASGGIQMEQGLTVFFKERNYQLGDRKVELHTADTAGNPAQTRTKTQELVERLKVSVLIGPLAAFEIAVPEDGDFGGALGVGLGVITARFLDRILTSFPGLPAAISFFVPEPRSLLLAAAVLLVNLGDMIDFFGDGCFQPDAPMFRRRHAARAVRPGRGVVIPGRVGDQRPAFDPIHEIAGGGDEIRLVHHPLHVNCRRKQVQHHRLFPDEGRHLRIGAIMQEEIERMVGGDLFTPRQPPVDLERHLRHAARQHLHAGVNRGRLQRVGWRDGRASD